MKKILILVILIAVLGAVIWKFNVSPTDNTDKKTDDKDSSTVSVPTSKTVKVSDKLSEYRNDELGFSMKYPSFWEKSDAPSNVSFFIPSDSEKEKNTLGKIEAKVDVISGKCSFPPVTTVNERDVLKVGNLSFNMISIANTIQNRSYFNRMYSLQKDSICYFFTFSSIVVSPTSRGLTGADAQKVGAQNKTLVDAADNQFKDMIKSFAFVVGPVGEDETKVSPKK